MIEVVFKDVENSELLSKLIKDGHGVVFNDGVLKVDTKSTSSLAKSLRSLFTSKEFTMIKDGLVYDMWGFIVANVKEEENKPEYLTISSENEDVLVSLAVQLMGDGVPFIFNKEEEVLKLEATEENINRQVEGFKFYAGEKPFRITFRGIKQDYNRNSLDDWDAMMEGLYNG